MPSLVAVACFLSDRAKDLTAPSHMEWIGIVPWNSRRETGEWPTVPRNYRLDVAICECVCCVCVLVCVVCVPVRQQERERERWWFCLPSAVSERKYIFCHLYIWFLSTGVILHKREFGTYWWCLVSAGRAVLPEGAYWYSLASEIIRICLRVKHSHEGTKIHAHLVIKTLGVQYRQILRPLQLPRSKSGSLQS
jgi:hypothetical protein